MLPCIPCQQRYSLRLTAKNTPRSAKVSPSHSAVKNPESKRAKPINARLREKMRKAETVSASSSGAYPTKRADSGTARGAIRA